MSNKPKELGLFSCVMIIIGGCVGSAIYSLSGMTIFYAGPSAIVSWVIAALLLMFYGMQVAELSVRYPKSGGIFVFPERAIGEHHPKLGACIGFISAWGYIISNIIAIAFAAIYVATYLGFGIPTIGELFGGGTANQVTLALIALVLILVMNLMQTSELGKLNSILVAVLSATLLVFIGIACFGGTFDIVNFNGFFISGSKGATGWISAVPIASCAYGACLSVAFMVSEVKNPNRTVPKALAIGLTVVMVFYVLVLVATVGNLPTGVLMDEENAFFRYIPMFAATMVTPLGKYAAVLNPLIAVSALIALLTTMLVMTALNARAIQAVSESGYLPAFLGKNSRNGVPVGATIVTIVLAGLLSCRPDWTEILVNLGALFAIISMVVTCVSLIVARKNHPSRKGDYKAPLGNVLTVICMIVMTFCYLPDLLNGTGQVWGFTGIAYLLGLGVFFLFSARRTAEQRKNGSGERSEN